MSTIIDFIIAGCALVIIGVLFRPKLEELRIHIQASLVMLSVNTLLVVDSLLNVSSTDYEE